MSLADAATATLQSIITTFGYNEELAKGTQSFNAQTGGPGGVSGEAWDKIKHRPEEIHREKEQRYLEAHGYEFAG